MPWHSINYNIRQLVLTTFVDADSGMFDILPILHCKSVKMMKI